MSTALFYLNKIKPLSCGDWTALCESSSEFERRIILMNSITRVFELVWRDASMKKDCEIPWYLRIAR